MPTRFHSKRLDSLRLRLIDFYDIFEHIPEPGNFYRSEHFLQLVHHQRLVIQI
jgi:hypothetical protein